MGLFVSSLDEENATCLPAFFVGPGLNAFSAMTASLFPSSALTTETQQLLPSLRETVYMFYLRRLAALDPTAQAF